jgi:hypothetical protein
MNEMLRVKKFNVVCYLALAFFALVLCTLEKLDAAQPEKGIPEQVTESEKRLNQLVQTAEKMKGLLDDLISKKITASEQRDVNAYSKWLKQAMDQMNTLSSRWETYLRNKNLTPAKKEIKYDPKVAEDLRLLNLQYQLLRNKIYQENKDFQMSSNALKKKRETISELLLKLK